MTPQQLFQRALTLQQSGQFAEAEKIYRELLKLDPKHPDILGLMGILCYQTGRPIQAIDYLRRAISIAPNLARMHHHLGVALHNAGRSDEAIAAFRRALELQPDQAETLSNFGETLAKSGHVAEAVAACRRAVALKPDLSVARQNLGCALADSGKFDEAIAQFQEIIRLRPNEPEAMANLGLALCYEGRAAEAIAICRRALAIRPDYIEATNHLGMALRLSGKADEAIALFNKVLTQNPKHPGTLNNLGNAFMAKRDLARAEEYFRAGIAANPRYASPQWNLGLLRLTVGDYQTGLPLYEWRKKVPRMGLGLRSGREWDGKELNGKRILIYAEQAFGDVLQCIRYVPLVSQRGGKVILACPRELHELMHCIGGVEHHITLDDPPPPFVVACSIMSLPVHFYATHKLLPESVPYLKADPKRIEMWRTRLTSEKRLKVGIAWTGRLKPDPLRAVPTEELAPLATAENVHFFSLQKPASPPPPGLSWTDWTHELSDFSDTAALVANLDLVITVDTSVAHLAGGMGKPTWVLLKDVPDWRWHLDRNDSPWYPTARLFRQPTAGDWKTPIAQAIEALRVSPA